MNEMNKWNESTHEWMSVWVNRWVGDWKAQKRKRSSAPNNPPLLLHAFRATIIILKVRWLSAARHQKRAWPQRAWSRPWRRSFPTNGLCIVQIKNLLHSSNSMERSSASFNSLRLIHVRTHAFSLSCTRDVYLSKYMCLFVRDWCCVIVVLLHVLSTGRCTFRRARIPAVFNSPRHVEWCTKTSENNVWFVFPY